MVLCSDTLLVLYFILEFKSKVVWMERKAPVSKFCGVSMQTGPAIIIFSMWLFWQFLTWLLLNPSQWNQNVGLQAVILDPPAAMANAQMASSTHKMLSVTWEPDFFPSPCPFQKDTASLWKTRMSISRNVKTRGNAYYWASGQKLSVCFLSHYTPPGKEKPSQKRLVLQQEKQGSE